MENVNLLHEFVLVCGIVVTLIILLLLAKKQNGYLHQRLILLFFFTILLLFFFHYAAYHKIYWLYTSIRVITNGISFLIGPLIYFYIAALFTKVDYKAPLVWLNFLPYFLYTLIFSLPLTFSNPVDGLLFPYLETYLDNPSIVYIIETLYLLVFTILSLRLLTKYATVIDGYYSDVTKTDILWSKRLLLVVIFYLIIDIILTISEFWVGDFQNFDIYINVFTMLFVVIYLGYYGFFQSQILIPSFLLNQKKQAHQTPVKNKPVEKPSSLFSKIEIEELKRAIEQALVQKKLYLNESLTLSNLAEEVKLTDKKLSTFINQELSTNFYELVNTHRINAFKKEINSAENQHLTIWGIASQCGFNSKTSFNRIFKKQIGMTPSQYQKTLNKKA